MKKQLIRKIEIIRDYMNNLINEKGSLTDPEVILVSQVLDSNLNKYNRLAS